MTTHIRPDGDAVGSVVALQAAIEQAAQHAGRDCAVELMLLSEAGELFEFLLPKQYLILGKDITEKQIDTGKLDEYDLIIVADTSAPQQLPGLGDYLLERTENAPRTGKDVLVIDHHLAGGKIGSCRLIDSQASAAGEIVFDLCREAGWPIEGKIAEGIFVAVATDTGWFRFESTSSRTFAIMSDLVKAGVRPDKMHQRLYQNYSPQRLRLLSMTLGTMELHCQGRLAVMHITCQMLAESGTSRPDIEDIVNEPMQIGSVLAVLLLIELDDGNTRGSLRSKELLDVSAVASEFGGGGHARAAGLTVKDNLQAAREKVVEAIKAKLEML